MKQMTLVLPSSVVGVVNNQKILKSPDESVTKDKSNKKTVSLVKSSADNNPTISSTDSKIEALDQMWSEWFNRLEALLLARTLDKPQQELTFQTLKVAQMNIPPASAVN